MGQRPGKGAVPANAHLPEVLLLVLCYRRSYGLSRRSAPRNGRGRACPRTHAFTFRAPRSLAPADPCLSSACHCEQRSCNRRHPANFCMSLRTSAHTGVAIRVPAEKRDKLVAVGANSQLFRIRLKCCFLSCSTARRSGLPRRSAPRNDMQKLAACPHNTWALPVYCRKASLQPLTPARLQHVIANQCAHWCGNPRPRRNAWQVSST